MIKTNRAIIVACIMFKTIYLTGAPASGKTTTVELLKQSGRPIEVWSYGSRLQEYLAAKSVAVEYADLRTQSSSIVRPADIEEVDRLLVSFVAERRDSMNIIIDSHPVTKEHYGFRVTAFSQELLLAVGPDEIWVTYASAAETVTRVSADPQGRPQVTVDEAAMHTGIQAALATTYGVLLGRPVYFFDTDNSAEGRIATMVKRLG
jgi:adenylate kinase